MKANKKNVSSTSAQTSHVIFTLETLKKCKVSSIRVEITWLRLAHYIQWCFSLD